MKIDEKGFGLVEGLLAGVVVLLLGFGGFYVWNESRNSGDEVADSEQAESIETGAQDSSSGSPSGEVADGDLATIVAANVLPDYQELSETAKSLMQGTAGFTEAIFIEEIGVMIGDPESRGLIVDKGELNMPDGTSVGFYRIADSDPFFTECGYPTSMRITETVRDFDISVQRAGGGFFVAGNGDFWQAPCESRFDPETGDFDQATKEYLSDLKQYVVDNTVQI